MTPRGPLGSQTASPERSGKQLGWGIKPQVAADENFLRTRTNPSARTLQRRAPKTGGFGLLPSAGTTFEGGRSNKERSWKDPKVLRAFGALPLTTTTK